MFDYVAIDVYVKTYNSENITFHQIQLEKYNNLLKNAWNQRCFLFYNIFLLIITELFFLLRSNSKIKVTFESV